jgi:hypothetical protein
VVQVQVLLVQQPAIKVLMQSAVCLKIEQLERLKQQMVKVLIRRKVFQKQRYVFP